MLLVVALAARAATLGSPLVHVDEDFYLAAAYRWSRGLVPYVDWWDRKPAGLFLLYLPAGWAGLPAGPWLYQGAALLAATATAALVVRLAAAAGWARGGLAAGILYLLWLDLGDGQGGQAPVFYNLLVAAAAGCTWRATWTGRRRWGVAAMALVGLALQIKYSVVFEGIGFALWLLAADRGRPRGWPARLGHAALLAAAALLPTAVAFLAWIAIGQGEAFAFANFVSILRRAPDDPSLRRDRIVEAAAILSPLLLSLPAWSRDRTGGARAGAGSLWRWWLVVAIAGFVGFGGWYNHYTLPVMLPASVCAAALFARGPRLAAIPLVLLGIAGQVALASERARRGSSAEFDALAAAVGRGPGGLWLYSGPTLLYPATGRPAPTRWFFPSHLEFRREAGSIGVDQAAEIRRILGAARPAAVVMAPPIREEDPALRALTLRLLRRGGYARTAVLPLGHDRVAVYRLTSRP